MTEVPDVEDTGGINIQKAKEYLKKEDEYDKKLFSERIKQRHKVKIL